MQFKASLCLFHIQQNKLHSSIYQLFLSSYYIHINNVQKKKYIHTYVHTYMIHYTSIFNDLPIARFGSNKQKSKGGSIQLEKAEITSQTWGSRGLGSHRNCPHPNYQSTMTGSSRQPRSSAYSVVAEDFHECKLWQAVQPVDHMDACYQKQG